MKVAPGATDQTVYFKLVHPTTGVPVTGATIANLDLTYVRDRAAAVKADLSTPGGFTVSSAHTDNAAIEVDSTNAPGMYRVDVPDAAFAAGVGRVQLVVNGAAIDPAIIEVELAPWLTPITGATVRAVDSADAAVATATALATAQADLDNPAQYKADVSGLATALELAAVAATLTTLYNRVGAFTGSGVNTVLGFLKALASKAASTPSDVGGTFSAATDSVEALQEKIAALPTLGAGTTPLVVTVTDGATPIDGVEVDVTLTTAHANPVATGTSDAFGKVTFHLDPGTYYVWVQHARYNATNPTAVVVA